MERIHINTRDEGDIVVPLWKKLICAGRAAEGLRADWQAQFRNMLKDMQFEYIRFHGLFEDEMGVCRRDSMGKLQFSWQYLDQLFDFLLSCQVRPVVEFGFMPPCMASGDKTMFWWKGNVTPPVSYEEWNELISNTVKHFKDRYGIDEIRKWYFEVWNEPNYHAFWAGTQEDYWKLYRVTALAVKSIDKELKIGGPGTTQFIDGKPPWVEELIQFCHQNNLPLDFISFHPYPNGNINDQIMQYREENATYNDLKVTRELLSQSDYADTELILTEWNSSYSPRDAVHDTAFMAPFIIQNYLMCRGLVTALGFWTFTDVFEEEQIDNRMFHGGFGMLNLQGIKKPAYHGFWFLNRLGDRCIGAGNGYFVTKKGDDCIQILMWNYIHYSKEFALGDRTLISDMERYEKVFADEEDKAYHVRVEGLGDVCRINSYHFDRDNGSAYDAWMKMNCYENLTEDELAILKQKSYPEARFSKHNQEIYEETIHISPHGICLIELYSC